MSGSHHLCLLTLRDRLYLAPVENPRRVLDVGESALRTRDQELLANVFLGTGSGLWAM